MITSEVVFDHLVVDGFVVDQEDADIVCIGGGDGRDARPCVPTICQISKKGRRDTWPRILANLGHGLFIRHRQGKKESRSFFCF